MSLTKWGRARSIGSGQAVFVSIINCFGYNTDITVSYDQHKQGRTITGFTFKFKQKAKVKTAKAEQDRRDPHTLDMFVPMTDNQRFAFAKKISKLPEASHLAKGNSNQSYDAFADQIAQDLLNNDKQKVYLPFLEKVGFKNLLDPVWF